MRRDLYHFSLSTPVYRVQAKSGELLLAALRVRTGQVDLVDGDDDRDLGGPGVVDGFLRLRHGAVICRDHQHSHIRYFGAARSHLSESFMSRGIDKGHLYVSLVDPVGAEVLGNSAMFLGGYLGFSNFVEQRGLAVVDMPQERYDRCLGDRILFVAGFLLDGLEKLLFVLLLFLEIDLCANLHADLEDELFVEEVIDGNRLAQLEEGLDEDLRLHSQRRGEIFQGQGHRDLNLLGSFEFNRFSSFSRVTSAAFTVKAPAFS